jgi:hypothetical protein
MVNRHDMNSAGGPELLALRKGPAQQPVPGLRARFQLFERIKADRDKAVELASNLALSLAEAQQELAKAKEGLEQRDAQRIKDLNEIKTLGEDLAMLQALTKAALEAKETGKPATVDWPPPSSDNTERNEKLWRKCAQDWQKKIGQREGPWWQNRPLVAEFSVDPALGPDKMVAFVAGRQQGKMQIWNLYADDAPEPVFGLSVLLTEEERKRLRDEVHDDAQG